MKMLLSMLFCSLMAFETALASTLVTKGPDGTYKPGVAKSWKSEGSTTTFSFADETRATEVGKILSERLANAKITVSNTDVRIVGIPSTALLEQVAALSLEGQADPLADLAGLGGAVAVAETPEGGGSIRASKPSGKGFLARSIKDHDPSERFEAEVVEVRRNEFPAATLRLKVARSAKTGPLNKKLVKGQIIDGAVVMAGTPSQIDLASSHSQRNMGAYYLSKGDHVIVHFVEASANTFEIDWLERAK